MLLNFSKQNQNCFITYNNLVFLEVKNNEIVQLPKLEIIEKIDSDLPKANFKILYSIRNFLVYHNFPYNEIHFSKDLYDYYDLPYNCYNSKDFNDITKWLLFLILNENISIFPYIKKEVNE